MSSTGLTADKKQSSRAGQLIKNAGAAVIIVAGFKIALPLLGKAVNAMCKKFNKGSLPVASSLPSGGLTSPVPQQAGEEAWQVLVDPPPGLPPDYKLLATAQLPCSVYDFYHHVINGQSQWMDTQHMQMGGQYNYARGAWTETSAFLSSPTSQQDKSMLNDMGKSVFEYVLGVTTPQQATAGYARTVMFMQPKSPPATVDARCVQRQQFAVFAGDTLVFTSAMNFLNIPFKECFTVNTAWQVKPSGPGQCTITITAKVNFVKGTLLASIIRAGTQRDTTRFYKALVDNLTPMLTTSPPAPLPPPTPATSLPRNTAGGMPTLTPTLTPSSRLPHITHHGKEQGGELLAHTMPMSRQLRVLFVLVVLIGSVLHQVALHLHLAHVTDELRLLTQP